MGVLAGTSAPVWTDVKEEKVLEEKGLRKKKKVFRRKELLLALCGLGNGVK